MTAPYHYRLTADNGAIAYVRSSCDRADIMADTFKRWGFGTEIRRVVSVEPCTAVEADPVGEALKEAGIKS